MRSLATFFAIVALTAGSVSAQAAYVCGLSIHDHEYLRTCAADTCDRIMAMAEKWPVKVIEMRKIWSSVQTPDLNDKYVWVPGFMHSNRICSQQSSLQ
jgi:hypothetical protein